MNARHAIIGGYVQFKIVEACTAKGCILSNIANGVCNTQCHNAECYNDGGDCEGVEINALKAEFPQYRATINQAGFAYDGIVDTSWLTLPASSDYYIGSTNLCDYAGWSEPGHQEYQDVWSIFRPEREYYQRFIDAGASLTPPPTTYCRLPLAILTGTCDRSTTAINPKVDWFKEDSEDACVTAFAEWIKWLEVNGQAIDSAGTTVHKPVRFEADKNNLDFCLFGICEFPKLGSQWLAFTKIIQDYVLEAMAPAQRAHGNYENAMNNVFVDTSAVKVDYDKYFAACSVTECVYTKPVDFSPYTIAAKKKLVPSRKWLTLTILLFRN
jgi:hypothetical protein